MCWRVGVQWPTVNHETLVILLGSGKLPPGACHTSKPYLTLMGINILYPAIQSHPGTLHEFCKYFETVPSDVSTSRNHQWGSQGVGSCMKWPTYIQKSTWRPLQTVLSDFQSSHKLWWGPLGLGVFPMNYRHVITISEPTGTKCRCPATQNQQQTSVIPTSRQSIRIGSN